MHNTFDFNDLFVLDLANNHQGSVEHGKRIISEMSAITKKHGIRAGIKFQFRQLDSFIHPDYKDNTELPHIPRFMSTRMDKNQFRELYDEVRKNEQLAICTPFDEESVDLIEEMGFDIIKIASCSIKDWPLLERVAEAGKPVIASTGGSTIEEIDNLVSFFRHRGIDFALMHCVSIYPTPDDEMQMNVISLLRTRYPGVCIGWSTHENPEDTLPVAMAVSKGARMFERHVGVETDEIKLNKYSSTSAQVDKWMEFYRRALLLCGPDEKKISPEVEQGSLESLQRGVYAKKPIKKGALIERDMVFFAMPYQDNQLQSGKWKEGITAQEDIQADDAILKNNISVPEQPGRIVLNKAVHKVSALLNEARIALNSDFEVEYSHHYGLENFMETGAVIITCVNRSYAKKIVVQLPGQFHPKHYHKKKEETFQVLSGILHAEIDGHERILHPGETVLIQTGVWHSFWTETGVVFEEISTRHYNDDSHYADKTISSMERHERKTVVDHWGRFQIIEK